MKRLTSLLFVVLVLVLVSGCGESYELGDTWTRPNDEMVMVYVPKGEFEMGSSEGHDDEQPVHTVALDGFWIDRTEATNAQYRRCVEAGDCETPGFMCMEFTDEAKTNHPMACVDWFGAEAYCVWAGARLPTEAEWEYAARGPEGFKYPWGDDEPNDTLLNYDDNVGDTTDVGSYPDGVSWCGALDMAGNAIEWVADWYVGDYYAASPSRNPTGPSSGEYKGQRGGPWSDIGVVASTYLVRGAYRDAAEPGVAGFSQAVRCAKDAD